MLSALLAIVIAVVILALLWMIVGMLPLPPAAKNIVGVLFLLVLLIFALERLGLLRLLN